MCAGQGRDVIGTLAVHARVGDVSALLVELYPRLVEQARDLAQGARLPNVEVALGDASLTTVLADAVPADVLLICGVFGNVSDDDIHETVALLPGLLTPGGIVIWTRHRQDPELMPTIRSWFAGSGFEEVAFDSKMGSHMFGVGAHRLVGATQPYERPPCGVFGLGHNTLILRSTSSPDPGTGVRSAHGEGQGSLTRFSGQVGCCDHAATSAAV
jgi:hypothetical protein